MLQASFSVSNKRSIDESLRFFAHLHAGCEKNKREAVVRELMRQRETSERRAEVKRVSEGRWTYTMY
jgi:hypothetical protein